MRNAFAREVHRLAAEHDDLVLLSGDIGNRLFNPFKKDFGERFFNCGVAEANMISVAAGMAMSGLRPVAYTIVPFITTRCLEQIRVDVCYHRQPVIIVGVGGGLSYANLGATHHACEDIAAMRSLPGMQVVCPADAHETALTLRAAVQQNGPIYIRIGKKGEPHVHDAAPEPFAIGTAIPVSPQTNAEPAALSLLACGTIAAAAQDAAAQLRERGARVDVYSFHTVRPFDEACLRRVFESSSLVCTLEEHNAAGGFGSAVAEWLADHQPAGLAKLLRIAAPDAFFCETGSPEFARSRLQLDAAGILARIQDDSRFAAMEGRA